MLRDTTLKTQFDGGDFWDAHSDSTIGNLWNIINLQRGGDLEGAQTALAFFEPVNLVEENFKAFYEILIAHELSGNAEIDTAQLDSLTLIAEQCPDPGGLAVHLARAQLAPEGIEIYEPNACDESGKREFGAANATEETKFSIVTYPNPSNGQVTFELRGELSKPVHVKIKDLLGREVFSFELNEIDRKKELNFNNFTGGVYPWEGKSIDTHFTGKVIIQK